MKKTKNQILKLLNMRYITILLVLFTGLLNAQEKWSLEQCITYALNNNIQIKQQELNTQVQKNKLKQSRIDLAPSLNGSLSRNMSVGRSVDSYTNEFTEETTTSDNYSINSQVTLFRGFQKINTIKQNRLDLKASLADLEKYRNDISLNISSAYLSVLFNYELLETAENQLDITREQEDRTEKLVNAGSLAKGDLLEILAQKANEELQIVNSENQLAVSLLNLKQMLELDTLGNFDIVKPNVQVESLDLPLNPTEVFEYASENMPQVMSAQFRLESYQKSLSIAKGGRSPYLTLGAGISTGYSDARKEVDNFSLSTAPNGGYALDASGNQLPTYVISPNYSYKTKSFSDQVSDNRNTYAVLTLNIPIFNGWQVNTNISNSRINVLNARYALDLEKKNLYKEIHQKYLDALASKKKYVATESALKSMQEFFDYSQKKFDVGMINTLDYNLAKNRVAKASSDLLQAKYEYVFAVEILNFYQGKPLTL